MRSITSFHPKFIAWPPLEDLCDALKSSFPTFSIPYRPLNTLYTLHWVYKTLLWLPSLAQKNITITLRPLTSHILHSNSYSFHPIINRNHPKLFSGTRWDSSTLLWPPKTSLVSSTKSLRHQRYMLESFFKTTNSRERSLPHHLIEVMVSSQAARLATTNRSPQFMLYMLKLRRTRYSW